MSGNLHPSPDAPTDAEIREAVAELERQGVVERVGPDEYRMTPFGRQHKSRGRR